MTASQQESNHRTGLEGKDRFTFLDGGLRLDWILTILSFWYLDGLFHDVWAHAHDFVDESFFTVWHASALGGGSASRLL